MRDLRSNGEPVEWVGKQPQEFKRRPTTAAERASNFSKYLTGYPWIVIAEDKGGIARYFCGICSKVATVTHLLSSHHIEKTTSKFHDAGVPNPTLDGKIQGDHHHGQGRRPLRIRWVRPLARSLQRVQLQASRGPTLWMQRMPSRSNSSLRWHGRARVR